MAQPQTNGATPIPEGAPHNPNADTTVTPIETPYLIIGAGPAGSSLASFLGSHNLKGILLSSAPGTAKEPRAHITNPAALECLRDIGLEAEALRHATSGDHLEHTRWCYSMAGAEYARIHSWGNQPDRQGDYVAASPCRHVDLPQTLLEPVLVGKAYALGWRVRFDTTLLHFEREGEGDGRRVLSTVRDEISGVTYRIRSKYLFGADGARSVVTRQLEIPLIKEPGQGLAINILVDADLSKHLQYRTGNLHWIMQPTEEHPPWGWACILRMVKAWNQWMFIVFCEPGFEDFSVRPSHDEYMSRIREFIGDDTIEPKILDVSKWYINEIVAERYSDDNRSIFCLGDATHRHPPLNGLGSNTCVQDAFNLAWKIAYVERGLAPPQLLDSFSLERQPIGAAVVKRANQGLRDHVPVWQALGALPKDLSERRTQHAELSSPSREGRERREALRKAVKHTAHEFGGIGIEMNQRYDSGAICFADEEKAARPPPPEDEVLEYQISTYPGSRCPHAWLNKTAPVEPVSTIDLAGHGDFCLLTGPGGEGWRAAAETVGRELGLEVRVWSIGWRQDWEDVYGDWAERREVKEDGCVVLRPDRTVCWRSIGMRRDAREALGRALRGVLGWGV